MAKQTNSNPLPRAAYTVAEVAASLGIDRDTVYRLLDEGKIPSARISPGRRIIPRVAFEQWLEAVNETAAKPAAS